MWTQLFQLLAVVLLTSALTSLLTIWLGYLIFNRYFKDSLLEYIDQQVEAAVDEMGREVEERVKQGVVDGVASLPSTEVLAGAGRTAARSGVDLVSTLLGMGRRTET